MKTLLVFLAFVLLSGTAKQPSEPLRLTKQEAEKLSSLPLKCIRQEYPNKLGQVLSSDADLKSPGELHPCFYGCFDWHSSVHGHWSLVKMLKAFPRMDHADSIRTLLKTQISEENILQEVKYFGPKLNKSYERT